MEDRPHPWVANDPCGAPVASRPRGASGARLRALCERALNRNQPGKHERTLAPVISRVWQAKVYWAGDFCASLGGPGRISRR